MNNTISSTQPGPGVDLGNKIPNIFLVPTPALALSSRNDFKNPHFTIKINMKRSVRPITASTDQPGDRPVCLSSQCPVQCVRISDFNRGYKEEV